MIKLCVFDMDGLLIDSEKIYLINALACNEIYGYGIPEELIRGTMGVNETETKRRYLETMDQDFPFDEFLHNEWVLHLDYMKKHPLEKKKGVDELFAYLEQNKIKKALATSTDRQYAISFLQSVNLENRFDHIVFGDDLNESKPKPEIYLKAIKPFPFVKDEILAFEDSGNGILSAYNAGLKVIHIPDLAYVADEVKEKSFRILNDLTEAIELIQQMNHL